MPPRIVFDVGLPCALLSVTGLIAINTREKRPIYSPSIPMGRGTVEGCAGETGRGDTLMDSEGTSVVAVLPVGRASGASGCRDVDEDRCLRGKTQLHFRLNHCFIAGCVPWGVDMAMRLEGSPHAACHARTSCHDGCQCQP